MNRFLHREEVKWIGNNFLVFYTYLFAKGHQSFGIRRFAIPLTPSTVKLLVVIFYYYVTLIATSRTSLVTQRRIILISSKLHSETVHTHSYSKFSKGIQTYLQIQWCHHTLHCELFPILLMLNKPTMHKTSIFYLGLVKYNFLNFLQNRNGLDAKSKYKLRPRKFSYM